MSQMSHDLSPSLTPRITQRVPHVEQELLTLPIQLSTPIVLVGFMFLGLLLSVSCFVDRCLVFWPLYCLPLL